MSRAVVAAIAGGVVIVLVVATLALSSALSGSEDADSSNADRASQTDSSAKEEPETPVPSAEPITAKALVELRVACVGGAVSNAGAYAKPYRYVIYENNNHSDSTEKEDWKWDLYAVASDDESILLDSHSKPSELNVVVCLDRDDSTAVKTMTCTLQRGAGMAATDPTDADFHAVKYDVTLYEAQSGKKITELAPINGPATTCPSTYYEPEDPSIYGNPDLSELNTRLEAFAR